MPDHEKLYSPTTHAQDAASARIDDDPAPRGLYDDYASVDAALRHAYEGFAAEDFARRVASFLERVAEERVPLDPRDPLVDWLLRLMASRWRALAALSRDDV